MKIIFATATVALLLCCTWTTHSLADQLKTDNETAAPITETIEETIANINTTVTDRNDATNASRLHKINFLPVQPPPTTKSTVSPNASLPTQPTSTTIITTSVSPNSTTTTPPTTTTNATTTSPTTTPITSPTTSKPNITTSAKPSSSSVSPTAPNKPTVAPTTVPPSHERQFDGLSFIGGIILAASLTALGFIGFKFYKDRVGNNYHTL